MRKFTVWKSSVLVGALVMLGAGVGHPAFGETYTLANDDPMGDSSMSGGGAGWKNESGTVVKHTPSEGNVYIVDNGYEIRTPPKKDSTVFNAELHLRTGQLRFKLNNNSTFTLADAYVDSGVCEFIPGDSGYRYYITGAIEIGPDGILQLDSQRTTGGDLRTFNLQGTLTGSGVLHGKVVEGKLGNEVTVNLDGDLSGFTGSIWLENPYTDSTYSYIAAFTSGDSIPGTMAEPTADGFVLENEVTARFETSASFDANRGFVCGKEVNGRKPTIYVAAGQEVVINGPVAGVQGFNKTGSGKLSIVNASEGLSGAITVSEGTLAYVSFPNAMVVTTGSGTTELINQDPTVKFIRASAVGYADFEDDAAHGITVTVDNPEPAVDYVKEWSTDGETFGPTEPKYQQAGTYKVWCRVSADGYESAVVNADVVITLHSIDATMTAKTVEPYLGGTHAVPVYSITEPAEGYTLEWTVNGEAMGTTEPVITLPGYYEISCTVSMPHYAPKTISGTLAWRYQGTVYVDADGGAGTPPFDSPGKATSDLNAAIQVAADGVVIQVASGEYTLPAAVTIGRALKVIGPADRSAVVKGGHGVQLKADGTTPLLTGFTFEGLEETAVVIEPDTVVSNCLFTGCVNPVLMTGGELVEAEIVGFTGYCAVCAKGTESEQRMVRTRISGGELNAVYDERGLSAAVIIPREVTLRMEDCEVSYCTNFMKGTAAGALSYGADWETSVFAARCRFVGNLGRCAFLRGGNDMSGGNTTRLENCLIAGNRSVNGTLGSNSWGSAKVLAWAKGEFVNCTFADNTTADETTGGLFEVVNSSQADVTDQQVVLENCICSGNDMPTVPAGRKLPRFAHSLYPECGAGDVDGNLPGPALFVGQGDDAYRLRAASPGVGAGALLDWTQDDTDLVGNRRVRDDRIDMGCYQRVDGGLLLFIR